MIVADTTLLANFYLEEGSQGEAMAVFERDEDWYASPLWRFELHSTLLKYIRARRLTISRCERILAKAGGLLHERERETSDAQVLQAAIGYGISAYDATHVALARQLRVPLITFDKKLVRAVPGIARSPEDFLG